VTTNDFVLRTTTLYVSHLLCVSFQQALVFHQTILSRSLRCCFYISITDISHVPGTKQISCCHSGSRCQWLCCRSQLITSPHSTPFPPFCS